MNQSENISDLAQALAKAQSEIKVATFDKQNPHFRSKYASFTSVMEVCKAPLSKNGIAVIQGLVPFDGGTALETRLIHVSGQWISSITPLLLDKNNMQGLGSAVTYARRYSLSAMVGVVSDEDDDGNAASVEVKNHVPEARNGAEGKVLVTAKVSLADKDKAKARGFQWNNVNKKWSKWMTEDEIKKSDFDFVIELEDSL